MSSDDRTTNDVVVSKTFDIEDTPDQAWNKLVRLAAAHDVGPGSWWLPGFQCAGTEVEAVPGERLELVKAQPPCEGTAIVITFEHSATGTRIHVTQSGFDPAFVEMAGDDFWAHGAFLLDEFERFFLSQPDSATT